MNDFKSVLDAPCVFCGYDGPNYLQKGSHKKAVHSMKLKAMQIGRKH